MTPRVVSTSAGPVELAEVGAGPVALIVHGSPGDWSQAIPLAHDLAATHRVLLPSRPGYGRTPLSTGRSPRQQAAAHAALLDAVGADRAAVIGISGGGPSARSFAVNHPDRCSQLVLICAVAPHLVTVPGTLRVLGAAPGLWRAGTRITARRKRRLLADPAAALAAALADLPPAERAAVAEDPEVQQDLLAFGAHNARVLTFVQGLRNDFHWFQSLVDREPWPNASVIGTLVLHGDADAVVPVAHGHDHAEGIPGSVLEVFPGVGHGLALTLRRTVSARILSFLQETA